VEDDGRGLPAGPGQHPGWGLRTMTYRARLLGGDISSAVRRVGGAVSLCSFTTIVGYGSLIFNDNQALESFGQLAMAGELATLFGALFLLPSLLHVWKRPPSAVHAADQVMR